jgi:tRNA-dihydrouridine synthase
VLGNGDVWEASDAVRMLAQTGADGVVIGRGCLGRPWLFADLTATLGGRATPPLPRLGEVAVMLRRHAELLAGLSDERHGCTELRKHVAWYLKGFPVGGDLRRELATVSGLAELDRLLDRLDPDAAFPVGELGRPRGRQGGPRERVALPDGWLDDTSGAGMDLADAELGVSGG